MIYLFAALAVLAFYALWGRTIAKRNAWRWPWLERWFKFVEPYEIILFKKSETILWARLKMLTGMLLTALTQLGSIDITPLMPFVPDKYEGIVRFAWNMLPLVITVVGWMDEKQRNETTKPIALVAVPEADMTPKVEAAIAKADAAKEAAVAVVEAGAAKV